MGELVLHWKWLGRDLWLRKAFAGFGTSIEAEWTFAKYFHIYALGRDISHDISIAQKSFLALSNNSDRNVVEV